MKKFLFILFIPFCCYSQNVSISVDAAAGTNVCSAVGSITRFSFGFTAGNVYLVSVIVDSSNNFPTGITLSAQTWDVVAQFGNDSRRMIVYRTAATSTHTDNVKVNFTGSNLGATINIITLSGIPNTNNGADAIRQYVIDSNSTANPSITMAAVNPSSGLIAIFSRRNDSFTGTPESGWTENLDAGCTNGASVNGYYIMSRNTSGSDNTPTVTASGAVDWHGIAIEIRGTRRIYNIH